MFPDIHDENNLDDTLIEDDATLDEELESALGDPLGDDDDSDDLFSSSEGDDFLNEEDDEDHSVDFDSFDDKDRE